MPAHDLVDQQSRTGTADGQSTVNGQVWQRLVSPDGPPALMVLREPEVTSIVAGDLPYEALEAYAATLSASG